MSGMPDDHRELSDGASMASATVSMAAPTLAQVPALWTWPAAVIRHARQDDIPEIIDLGYLMARESPRWAAMPYVPERVRALCERLLPTGGLIVAEADARVAGVIAGIVAEHFFTTVRFGTAVAFYIHPAYRDVRIARALVRSLEAWAAGHGAHECLLGIHTGFEHLRTAKLYRRLGYASCGLDFRRALTSAV